MKHRNGFIYFKTVPFIGDGQGYASPRAVQSARWDKAEKRDPRLTEMEEKPVHGNSFSVKFSVYLGGKTAWDRKHRELCHAIWDKLAQSTPAVSARLLRAMEYAEQANRAHLSTLTPEQARAAFDDYHATGLNGGSWGCLAWFEVLPPGITEQAAANAIGEGFTVDYGWKMEGERSVKRHATFCPNAQPFKGSMTAHRI